MDKKVAVLKTIIVCFLLYSCSKNGSLNEKQIGRYKVDFSVSDTNFTEKEKSLYKNSELELSEDGSFKFFGYMPTGESTIGEWEILGDELSRRLRLNYCCSIDESDICNSKNCVITISVPSYQDNIVSSQRQLAYRKYK
jgi:hypothetical protein